VTFFFVLTTQGFHSLRERVTSLLVQRSNQESTFASHVRCVRRVHVHVHAANGALPVRHRRRRMSWIQAVHVVAKPAGKKMPRKLRGTSGAVSGTDLGRDRFPWLTQGGEQTRVPLRALEEVDRDSARKFQAIFKTIYASFIPNMRAVANGVR
jgi:hypothetical protein